LVSIHCVFVLGIESAILGFLYVVVTFFLLDFVTNSHCRVMEMEDGVVVEVAAVMTMEVENLKGTSLILTNQCMQGTLGLSYCCAIQVFQG